ncbi:hypothetical protein [Bacillus altitudinis]|uniref:hypothetical protein n=1 Tax=Bacillus altitudinis TaxID=293387 RepID=UPI0039BFFA73
MLKEINQTEWMNFIKKMNGGKPRVIHKAYQSIELHEKNNDESDNGQNATSIQIAIDLNTRS